MKSRRIQWKKNEVRLAGKSVEIALGLMILSVSWFGITGHAEAKSQADSSLTVEDSSTVLHVIATSEDKLREQVRALQESLALANAEAEFFSEKWRSLRLKNEVLGADALTADEQRLQERVVQAVKELYQSEQDRREATIQLRQLISASQAVLKSVEKIDPQKRADYEVAVRSAREYLAGHGSGPIVEAAGLQNGQIVHVNVELNSVILNMGSRIGVKAGMPFRVMRQEKEIGRLKAFQVREMVSAALVEGLSQGEEVKVGDQVVVAAEK